MEKSYIFEFFHCSFWFLDFYIDYFHDLTPCWFIHFFTCSYSLLLAGYDWFVGCGYEISAKSEIWRFRINKMWCNILYPTNILNRNSVLNLSPSQRQQINYFVETIMAKYEKKTTKSVCWLPAQNTSTTKLENTSTTKGKGLGEIVLLAVTRSISEIFAGARIPCTWPNHISYQSHIFFKGWNHQRIPLLIQVQAVATSPQVQSHIYNR